MNLLPKAVYLPTITITGTTSITAEYNIVLANLTTVAVLTIPPANSLIAGFPLTIARVDSNDVNLIVEPAAGTISDVNSYILTSNTALQFVTDPANNNWANYVVTTSSTTSLPPEGSNTAYGEFALSVTPTGSDNTAIGYNALTNNDPGDDNTAVGYQACLSNTSGNGNVAVGSSALSANSTGSGNVAIGLQAMKNCGTAAVDNVAIGYDAGMSLSGNSNVAIGFKAAYNLTSGGNNVMLGTGAGYGASSGNNNIVIGNNAAETLGTGGANVFIGPGVAENVTTATSCVVIGDSAGGDIETGSDVVAIGYQAGSADVSHSVYIGNGTSTPTSNYVNNQVVLGNGSTGSAVCAAAWAQSSSANRKKAIEDQKLGLSFIRRLRPRSYLLKTESDNAPRHAGFVAQEIDAALREENSEPQRLVVDEGDDHWLYCPTMLLSPLVRAVQELTARLEAVERGASKPLSKLEANYIH